MWNILSACSPYKELEIPIPAYESKLVVESYLEPGEIYKLSLLENVSYFEEPRLPIVYDAEVFISDGVDTITLFNILSLDTINKKINNYISYKKVSTDINKTYSLFLKDKKGRTITSTVKSLPTKETESLTWKFNNQNNASVEINFSDDIGQNNYYRFLINKDSINGAKVLDKLIDDKSFSDGNGYFITGHNYKKDDTIVVSLFHLDKEYYEFLKSVESAKLANADPFSQPTAVKSNVNGGVGIFTFIAVDRKRVIIKEN